MQRFRDDMEQLLSQQEQTPGTLDTRIDPTKERRTQAIMDMPASNDPPRRDTHTSGRSDSSDWNHSNHRRPQPSVSGRGDIPEAKVTDTYYQTGHS